MARLFADTTDKELEENQLGAGMCLTIAFVLLIPIAGFFTCIWSSVLVLATDKEINLRNKERKE
jgi:hypothetical protein